MHRAPSTRPRPAAPAARLAAALAVGLALAAAACSGGGEGAPAGEASTAPESAPESASESGPGRAPRDDVAAPNILLVILDDVGVDDIGCYGLGSDPARTPTLDALAARGLRFDRAWAHPLCSPSRAAILTGRHPRRTGIGRALRASSAHGLRDDEVLLPAMLPEAYATALIGKWHLSNRDDGLDAPNRRGFDFFSGHLYNLTGTDNYRDWLRVEQGERERQSTYVTSAQVDTALDWLAGRAEPWFCVLSYTAPHEPWSAPPEHLVAEPPGDTTRELYKAMLEAADTELGRLLAAIDRERTLVVALADNGTPGPAVDASRDPRRAKGTVYEGGLHVPLIVAGPGVATGSSAAPVHVVDVAATLVERVGGDASTALDSVSFARLLADPAGPRPRRYLFAETFKPNGPGPWDAEHTAVREERFKLLRIDALERLIDLEADPRERSNLLLEREQRAILRELRGVLARERGRD